MVKFNKLKKNKIFVDEKQYRFLLCNQNYKKKLFNFINSYWKKKHIFTKHKDLFDWQHKQKRKFNFLIAFHKKQKKIHGICGFFSLGFFEKGQIQKNDNIWIAIIMSEKSLLPSKGLGIRMIKEIYSRYKPNSLSALGITEQVARLYKYLGFKLNKLNQYYILNPQIKKYRIAKILNNKKLLTSKKIRIKKNLILKINKLELKKFYMKKVISKFKLNYLSNRFVNHPIYKYKFLSLNKQNKLLAIFVYRVINVNKSKCMRIVEIVNLEKINFNIKNYLQEFLIKNKIEFLDFIYFNNNIENIRKIGFNLRKRKDKIIIPSHYEPFERKNIDIDFSYITKNNKFEVFKSHSDLDRPSII